MSAKEIFGKTPHPVTAVWLERRIHSGYSVHLEIGGRWIEVIRDNDTFASHTVESAGIQKALDHGKLVPKSYPCKCRTGECVITSRRLGDLEYCRKLAL